MRIGKWLAAFGLAFLLGAPVAARAQAGVFPQGLPPSGPSVNTLISPKASLLDYFVPGSSSFLNFFPSIGAQQGQPAYGGPFMSQEQGQAYLRQFGFQRPLAGRRRYLLFPF